MERPETETAGPRRIGRVRRLPRALHVERDDGVQRRVQTLDAREVVLEKLTGADVALLQQRDELDGGTKSEIGHAGVLAKDLW
jgi:hypothetical protein